MTVFADTSALVKSYADEDHSAAVHTCFEASDIAVSELTQVEIASALWTKVRQGVLTAEEALALSDAFAVDWFGNDEADRAYVLVSLDQSIFDIAVGLVARHGLRTGDAIQLASAVAARATDPTCDTFLCFDSRLRDAAAREGFGLLPAEL